MDTFARLIFLNVQRSEIVTVAQRTYARLRGQLAKTGWISPG